MARPISRFRRLDYLFDIVAQGMNAEYEQRRTALYRKNCCYYCGASLRKARRYRTSPHRRSWDHIIPTSRGGSNNPLNKVLACVTCNQEKNNMTLEEYRAYKGGIRFWGETYARI